jgi:hypothetical protein
MPGASGGISPAGDRSRGGAGAGPGRSTRCLFFAVAHWRHCISRQEVCGKRSNLVGFLAAATRLHPPRTTNNNLGRTFGGDEGKQKTHCEDLKKRMTSLSEILGHVPPIHTVKAAIVKGIAQALGVVFAEGQLTPTEWALAHKMVKQLKSTAEGHL